MNQTVSLAYDLCAISSVSGNEAAVVDFLETYLVAHDLVVERIATSPGRFNLFAYAKTHAKYSAIFCTHLDTVAPFIAPRIHDGMLWGRGSCDAKGIAACMISAVLNERECGFDDLALLLTVGEEEASDGAKACDHILADRAALLVVGEPTDLRAAFAQKGSLVFDLIAKGKEAHSSRPHLGDSAIHKLVNDVARLVSHDWPSHEIFGDTLINFGEILGGNARNMLASHAQAKGIMRASVPIQVLTEKIQSMLSPGVTLHVTSSTDPFRYFVPDQFESFLAGFGSDAAYLAKVGQPVLLGPGSLDRAHRDDEAISLDDMTAGVLAYKTIAHQARKKLCL